MTAIDTLRKMIRDERAKAHCSLAEASRRVKCHVDAAFCMEAGRARQTAAAVPLLPSVVQFVQIVQKSDLMPDFEHFEHFEHYSRGNHG